MELLFRPFRSDCCGWQSLLDPAIIRASGAASPASLCKESARRDMNDTIRSIVGMLDSEQPELRVAATQILGELGVKDQIVVKALAATLGQQSGFLDRYALTALSKIASSSAIRALVSELVEQSSSTELVGHLLAKIGGPAVKAIADSFDEAPADAQRRMLSILQQHPGRDSIEVLERALSNPGLAEAAAQGLRQCLGELSAAASKDLSKRLAAVALDATMDPPASAQALQVLAEIDASGQRETLVKCACPGRPPLLRRAALEALRDVKLTPTQLTELVKHLREEDATSVVEATTRLLADVESFPAKAEGLLVDLLDRGIPAIEEFAVRALGRVESEEVATKLLPLLHSERSSLRTAVAVALSTNQGALEPLVKALRSEKERARAERIAGPIAAQADEIETKTLASLVDRGQKLLLQQDAVGEVILLTLLRARGREVAAMLLDKAVRLRRAKKYEDATLLLMFVAQTGQLDSEGHYQLGLTRLLLDAKAPAEPKAASRAYTPNESGSATMGYFAVLVRDAFPVLDRIKRESMVTPEMLFRLAEHFADGVGSERRFGTELLEHVAAKYGKKSVGEEARSLLRTESL